MTYFSGFVPKPDILPPVDLNYPPSASAYVPINQYLLDITAAPYSADPTGAIDAAPAIRSAISAALASRSGHAGAHAGIYIPPGLYKLGSLLDLSTVFNGVGVLNFSIIADRGATFTGNGMILSPGATGSAPGQFLGCKFVLPCFDGSVTAPPANTTGVIVRFCVDCYIEIPQVVSYTQDGVQFDNSMGSATGAGAQGIYNNEVHIGRLGSNTRDGLSLVSSTAQGVQGNQFFIAHFLLNGEDGLNVEGHSTGGGNQSIYNAFYIGAAEHNTRYGIYDSTSNGANMYEVCNTNSNSGTGGSGTKFGFFYNGTGQPIIRGSFVDGVGFGNSLSPVDLIDRATAIGYLSSAPAVPSSGAWVQNTSGRPALVLITANAGGNFNVYVNNGSSSTTVPTGAAISVVVMPGDQITMTYSSAPTWKWVLI